MKCRECNRHMWCWVACDEVAAELAKMEEDAVETHRSIGFMIWVTILAIVALSAGSCAIIKPVPDAQRVNIKNLRGACGASARVALAEVWP